MKVLRIAVLFLASSFLAQPASAGLVSNVVNRTAHFVHKAAYKIDHNVVEPTHRAIVRHTPHPR